MDSRFELHCQTHFSIGKSIIDPNRLPEVAAGKGLAGIAVTDYFNVDGWIEAYYMMQHCTDKNMRLIYGAVICIRDDINKAGKEKFFDYYATVLVKNDIGRRNLFRILSMKATKYAGRDIENGWIYLSDLDKFREGLLVGWNCDNAYLHQDYGEDEKKRNRKKLEQAKDIFDYYEIAPFSYHPHFPIELTGSKDMTEWVMEFAEKHNRPLIAVSAAKYLDREENTEWKMLQDYSYHDGETGCLEQDVTAHLRSAGEMMELFSFLGNKKAREIVIDNPKMLVEQIELHEPFVNERIYPAADGGSQKLRAIVFSNAKKLYGEILPAEVSVRIEKELSGICEAGHDPIFLFVKELMEKAGILDEPHGFRSSSNNSFVAYLCGITTLNPLKPHYRCVECQYSDFETDALDAAIGYRLPNKSCPVCGTELIKDGFSLPYKFFLGMDGGKVPDFDLNVRPSVQKEVQNMVSSLSGVTGSFHAGTISTIGRRRAENIIDSYCSKFHFQLEEWEYDAYADELAGCARGYGLHPGKMLIFPKNKGEVTEHLPLRLLGGDVTTGIDFHQIDGLLYGIDILALDLLELLYELEKRTGCPVSEIDFAGRSVLKDIPKDRDGCFMLNGMAGFEGLSARQMVQKILSVQDDIDFWDFVKIHGLMHGTDVWNGNADSLLQRGHSLDEVIATKEDCFDFFYRHGMDGKTAYRIAEDVRKGKAGQDRWLDKWGKILRKHDIPEWYIDSCRKIRFLFPRGHCITYAQLYWQLLYYKANYPEDFYQCFFEIYADNEDKEIIAGGKTVIKAVLSKFAGSGNENDDVPRYDHNISVLKTALEMYEWKEMAKQA